MLWENLGTIEVQLSANTPKCSVKNFTNSETTALRFLEYLWLLETGILSSLVVSVLHLLKFKYLSYEYQRKQNHEELEIRESWIVSRLEVTCANGYFAECGKDFGQWNGYWAYCVYHYWVNMIMVIDHTWKINWSINTSLTQNLD